VNAERVGAGPFIWIGSLAATVLLLVALNKILWLVIPFLVAIILYYVLYPLVRRLVLGGIGRETSAAIVAGSVFALGVAVMIPLIPWLAAQAVSGEEVVYRYLGGGRALADRILVALEEQFGFLHRMNFAAEMGDKLTHIGDTFLKDELTRVLVGLIAWMPSMLLAPFLAFFFLRDGQVFLKFLCRSVPNAFFERTLAMLDRVDSTARSYFQGLLKLTAIDTVCLALGLWAIGMSAPLLLGLVAAVLAWVPFVGSVLGCAIVLLVAATDFPSNLWMAYASVVLFIIVRLLDDFVFMPLTLGRSLHMHPLPTVLLIFVGGAVAGVPGLMLVLPLAGVVFAVAETVGAIVTDPRLRARHVFARALRGERASADLGG
jgi:predicted PurR-regulated permease PerM